ncbi:glycosyltransferase family 4 protein [Mycolicibacterium sp. 3033]|nr:glycosyltransferase family 4 protein [Mycolicibacterium aurantiacum]
MRAHFQAVHLSQFWPVTVATERGRYEVSQSVFTAEAGKDVSEANGTLAYLRSVATRKHYLYEKYRCDEWDLPDLDEYTHVIVHYPALLQMFGKLRNIKPRIVLDTHNNEREYYRSVGLGVRNPIKRAVIYKQADVSEAILQKAKALISATISVSESDRDWVAAFCDSRARHFVVPNNLFQYEPTVWTRRRAILYVGSLNVRMNVQALDWFTANVWPAVRKTLPDLEFLVAGRNPPADLVSSLQAKGIEVIPNAESLKAVYADALCALIPATSGSGGKIKVAEALAHGVPVLTTTTGLVGQPAAIKACCTVEDDAVGWVSAIETIAAQSNRSSTEWDRQVASALHETYFGTSVKRVAKYLEDG